MCCYCQVSGVVPYRLYVIFTAKQETPRKADSQLLISRYVAERVRMLLARGCQITVSPDTDAAQRGGVIRALNELMMMAYLNDNVDYFHVVLSDALPSHSSPAR